MKHLKVIARAISDTKIEMYVKEHTHHDRRFAGFGHNLNFNNEVFGYNNVRLRNKEKNARYERMQREFGIEITLGSGSAVGRSIIIPKEVWPEVRAAINGYTELGRNRN